MARPIKEGLDYFSLDCKLDDKVYMVEVDLGIVGFGLFIKLLMKIYDTGYYIKWDERIAKIFAKQNNIEINIINNLINVCINEGLFHQKLYKSYQILTSNGIQKRYFEAVKKRKEVNVVKEYLLNGIENYLDSTKYGVKVNINSINDDINSINSDISTQSILKESILKESIYICEEKNISLTQNEYNKLIIELGEPLTKEYIKDLSLYVQSKGKKYKSHYATILSWHRKDIKEGKNREPKMTIEESLARMEVNDDDQKEF